MKAIRISDAVEAAIAKHGKFGENYDDVLRRILKLPPAHGERSEQVPSGSGRDDDRRIHLPHEELNDPAPTGPKGRGNRRYADKRQSCKVQDGRYHITLGTDRKNWLLPDKSDQPSIRRLRAEAETWARARGATSGQIDAVRKGLTDAGYYLIGPRTGRMEPPSFENL